MLPKHGLSEESASREFREFLVRVSEESVTAEEWNRCAIGRSRFEHIERLRQRLNAEILSRGQCSARIVPPGFAPVALELIAELDAQGESSG